MHKKNKVLLSINRGSAKISLSTSGASSASCCQNIDNMNSIVVPITCANSFLAVGFRYVL